MSKPDWKELQDQFSAAHASTGIKLKDWCELRGLKYESARRYIKKNAQKNAQNETAQKTAQPSTEAASAKEMAAEETAQKRAITVPKSSAFFAGLSPEEVSMVNGYLEHGDKYRAYSEAKFKGGDRAARKLFRKPSIMKAINYGLSLIQSTAILDRQQVLLHWHEIATADPSEISQLRRCCCRHCWGENFHYHWRDVDEYDKAAAKASSDGKPPPDYGGLGFIDNDDPNPDCPRCGGEGIGDVFHADTRDVTGPERRLIAGVKKTKFGIEILMRDQDAALKNLAAFHNLAASEQERELRLLEIERSRLTNQKLNAEIEALNRELAADAEDNQPTPVTININVVDASEDDGDQPDT